VAQRFELEAAIDAHADTTEITRLSTDLSDLALDLDRLGTKSASFEVRAETRLAEEQLKDIERAAVRLGQERPTVTVDARDQTREIFEGVRRGAEALGRLRPIVAVSARDLWI
jgi:hypothetical protein